MISENRQTATANRFDLEGVRVDLEGVVLMAQLTLKRFELGLMTETEAAAEVERVSKHLVDQSRASCTERNA